MKHRPARVKEILQRELGTLLERHFSFPGLLVTVKDVDVTPDFRQCHVYISVIGPEKEHKQVIAKLMAGRTELQAALAKRVILKFTPVLYFKLDNSAERGVRIIQIMEELGPLPPEDDSPPAKSSYKSDPSDKSDKSD